MENYLETLGFDHRRVISKTKCSDHALEIEKGDIKINQGMKEFVPCAIVA